MHDMQPVLETLESYQTSCIYDRFGGDEFVILLKNLGQKIERRQSSGT